MLSAGRHVRWGRHYTASFQDLRKASVAVAGQELLTADKNAAVDKAKELLGVA